MNKNKFIILMSVIVVLAVIGGVIIFTNNDKKDNETVTTTEPKTIAEKETTTETETTTELETATEIETKTEAPTVNPNDNSEPIEIKVTDFMKQLAFDSTVTGWCEADGIMFYKQENGVLYYWGTDASQVDFDNPIDAKRLIPVEQLVNIYTGTETELNIIPSTPSGGNSGNASSNEEETQPITSSAAVIMEWIETNYGESFTYDNTNYIYNAEIKGYYSYDIKTAHKMTSATTSEIVIVYKNVSKCTPEYLGAKLGYDDSGNVLFGSESIGKGDSLFDKNFNEVTYEENTEKYIKKSGCEQTSNSWYSNWEFMTSEGIPVEVNQDGYIGVYVKYLNVSEKVKELFSIEEYYAFLEKYADKFYVDEATGHYNFNGGEYKEYTDRWVVITE